MMGCRRTHRGFRDWLSGGVVRTVALLLGLCLVACAQVPTSGPVEAISPSASGGAEQPGVDIAANPPPPGADPEQVVAGFLAANSEFGGDFAVARQYLTDNAQKSWHPDEGIQIYSSEQNRMTATQDSASMRGPLIGDLDKVGRFTASTAELNHDFVMVRQNGQWRISNPPHGVLISELLFRRYFQGVDLQFLSADGTQFVPEQVFIPNRQLTPTRVVQALMAGPSGWLAGAVTTAIPADLKAPTESVQVDDGVATVTFDGQLNALGERSRTQVAAQLMGSLSQFSTIAAIRVVAGRQPWKPANLGSDGLVRGSDVSGFYAVDLQADAPLYGIEQGRVGTLDVSDGKFSPLTGAFGVKQWGGQPGQVALNRKGNAMAVLTSDRTRVFTGSPAGARATARLRGEGLLRPQVLEDRSVWTVQPAPRPELIRIDESGTIQRLTLNTLPSGGTVVNFRISADRSRVAMVVRVGATTRLGLMRIRGLNGQMVVDGWREPPLNSSAGLLTAFVDATWAGTNSLLVIGRTDPTGSASVYRISLDGSTVENLGPAGSGEVPRALTAFARRTGTTAVLMTDQQETLRLEDVYRWILVSTSASDIAYPGG